MPVQRASNSLLACCCSRSLRPCRGWLSPRKKVRCNSTVRSICSTNICRHNWGVGMGARDRKALLWATLPPPPLPPRPCKPAVRCCLGAPPIPPAASGRASPSPRGIPPAATPCAGRQSVWAPNRSTAILAPRFNLIDVCTQCSQQAGSGRGATRQLSCAPAALRPLTVHTEQAIPACLGLLLHEDVCIKHGAAQSKESINLRAG
jgi:hypothetical protein